MSIKSCRTCKWYWPSKEPQACCHGHGDFWPCDERGWCEDWELDTRHAETWILANYCPHCGRRVTT